MNKKILFAIGLMASTQLFAAPLPTGQQFAQLDLKYCGSGWPIENDGEINEKPLFAIKNQSTKTYFR